jgi:hypothetical protein
MGWDGNAGLGADSQGRRFPVENLHHMTTFASATEPAYEPDDGRKAWACFAASHANPKDPVRPAKTLIDDKLALSGQPGKEMPKSVERDTVNGQSGSNAVKCGVTFRHSVEDDPQDWGGPDFTMSSNAPPPVPDYTGFEAAWSAVGPVNTQAKVQPSAPCSSDQHLSLPVNRLKQEKLAYVSTSSPLTTSMAHPPHQALTESALATHNIMQAVDRSVHGTDHQPSAPPPMLGQSRWNRDSRAAHVPVLTTHKSKSHIMRMINGNKDDDAMPSKLGLSLPAPPPQVDEPLEVHSYTFAQTGMPQFSTPEGSVVDFDVAEENAARHRATQHWAGNTPQPQKEQKLWSDGVYRDVFNAQGYGAPTAVQQLLARMGSRKRAIDAGGGDD